MSIKPVLAVSTALWLTACASAPEVYDFQNTRTVAASKDVVWERVVEFFAVNNLSIKTIEKDSGIVAAERLFASPRGSAMSSWASCGSGALEVSVSQLADLNVFVRPVSGGTSVTVNTRFSEMRQFGNYPPTTVSCNSTGVLERTILNAVGGGEARSDLAPRAATIIATPTVPAAPAPLAAATAAPQKAPAKQPCGIVRQPDGSMKRVKC